MTRREKKTGRCLLLGSEGPFVRSHIIPRFLADKALKKAHRIEMGQFGAPPKIAFNSWFDPELCGQKGEERLRDIDTAAAHVFRRHGLSWRHFPLSEAAVREEIADSGIELIEVRDCDTKSLRIFFLSILWRCAASTRVEFAEIRLSTEHLEYLRQIVAGELAPSDDDWPSVLLLLTTKGTPQIFTPIAEEIDMRALGFDLPSVPIFRFFFDGLIVHMGRKPADKSLLDHWSGRVVGVDHQLTLIGRPYENSSQENNLHKLQDEMLRMYPETADKIGRVFLSIDQREKP